MRFSTYKKGKQLKRAVSPLILVVILLVISLSGCSGNKRTLYPAGIPIAEGVALVVSSEEVMTIVSDEDMICLCGEYASCDECYEAMVIK